MVDNEKKLKTEMYLHYSASTIGGYFGGYAIYNFYELFANAQTANLIHLVSKIVTNDKVGLFFIVLSFIAYVAGNAFYTIYSRFCKTDPKRLSLVLDTISVTAVGILVNFTAEYYVLLPILFTMPFQWNSFSSDAGYASSTIFSTNNLRQTTTAFTSYLIDKDEKMLQKAKFFGCTLLFYHIGVAYVCFLSAIMQKSSIWFCLLPIAVTVIMYIRALKASKTTTLPTPKLQKAEQW